MSNVWSGLLEIAIYGLSHYSNSSNEHEKDEKPDFTDYLNKLIYQMIFNTKEAYYNDDSSNSSSMKQAKKTKNAV